MPEPMLDPTRHALPAAPPTLAEGAAQARAAFPAPLAPLAGKDVCERLPAYLQPGCRLNGWLGADTTLPAARPARPARPTLDLAVRAGRAAMPATPHMSTLIHAGEKAGKGIEAGHLGLEVAESAPNLGAAVPVSVAAGAAGLTAALAFYAEANVQMAGANLHGIDQSRRQATAAGFAAVLSNAIENKVPQGYQRHVDFWHVPVWIPDRFHEDYRRGVRAGLDAATQLTRGQLDRLRGEIDQAGANVSVRRGEGREGLLERRLQVILCGYDRDGMRF